jgi:hypothetical protein
LTYNAPPIPTPPTTVNAPVAVDVATVEFVTDRLVVAVTFCATRVNDLLEAL